MVIHSILVEDCSPLIQYAPAGAWQDAQSEDTMAALYSGGSYHLSSSRGATATFKFRGTGFTILGGRRPGYGSFSLSLDGHQLYDGNPVPGSSPINNTLAVVSGLPYDDHTLVLTNSGGAPVDIDTIAFETEIGSAGEWANIATIDDTDPRIAYLPAAAWNVNTRPEFQNGTLHYSQAANASASLRFSGNAIGLYGTASPDHADMSVTIDGKTVTMPPGSGSRVNAVRTSVLLFFADNLPNGQHTMVVSKGPSSNATHSIDIDSFVVYSNGPSPHSSGLPAIKPNRAIVIAISTIAGVTTLFLLMLCAFLIFRQRHKRQRLSINRSMRSPVTPTLPMQFPSPALPSPAPPVLVRRSDLDQKRASNLSIAPSYYDDTGFLESRGSFEERGRSSVTSSERSILPAPHPVIRHIAEPPARASKASGGLSNSGVTSYPSLPPSQRPLRPPRPPYF